MISSLTATLLWSMTASTSRSLWHFATSALRAFNDYPAHKKAVEETLKPLVGRMVVYDFLDR
jgi:hypothetical protein